MYTFGGQSLLMLEITVVNINFSTISMSLQAEFLKIFCPVFCFYLEHACDEEFKMELFSILWSILCEVTSKILMEVSENSSVVNTNREQKE